MTNTVGEDRGGTHPGDRTGKRKDEKFEGVSGRTKGEDGCRAAVHHSLLAGWCE